MEEVKQEKEVNEVKKKRLSPDSTVLLTIGGAALVVSVIGLIHFIITNF